MTKIIKDGKNKPDRVVITAKVILWVAVATAITIMLFSK